VTISIQAGRLTCGPWDVSPDSPQTQTTYPRPPPGKQAVGPAALTRPPAAHQIFAGTSPGLDGLGTWPWSPDKEERDSEFEDR
jgi:hypothetical protein